MAGTADTFRAAVQASAAGQKVDSNSVEGLTSSSSPVTEIVDDGSTVEAGDSQVTELFASESGDTPADSAETASSEESVADSKPTEQTQQTSGKEVITITDDKGRRRIEVDFNDKEQVKKYVQMAYGARKWQAERDKAQKEHKALAEKSKELEQNWELMNRVFSEQGEEGLIDLLRGRKGAYQEHVRKQIDRAKFLERASPEEIQALEAREAVAKQERELARIREENEKFKKEVTEQKEQAEMRALESRVHPAFDKYRFAEKLGNPDDEHMFDEMLWNSALKRLEPYEEQGVAITPELVDREFRTVASAIRRRIGGLAEKKATRVVEAKKQEATENVQGSIKAGYRNTGAGKEAADLINAGNLQGLFKQWGKYGSLFQKK